MTRYAVLLRGINVGGKNKVPMAELKPCLEKVGCENIRTYIQSGNVILDSKLDPGTLCQKIETGLSEGFKLDSSVIRVLALTKEQLQKVVANKPPGFGDLPDTYHSDVIFLMGISPDEAMKVFRPREGVDKIWPGNIAIYSQRLSAKRTQSRLNRIVGTPAYQSMTIRNWNTTTNLLGMLEDSV